MHRKTKIFLAIVIFFLIACAVINLPPTQRILYPFPYRDKIEKHAARYRVDRFLAISVMKVERTIEKHAGERKLECVSVGRKAAVIETTSQHGDEH